TNESPGPRPECAYSSLASRQNRSAVSFVCRSGIRGCALRACDSAPFEHRHQPARHRATEVHRGARYRMAKLQLARVEREPPGLVAGRAILAIADDRMPQAGQLHANLVFAAGFEHQLDQRLVLKCSYDAIVRDCQLPAS